MESNREQETGLGTTDVFEHSVATRSGDREQLAADVDAFLNSGGSIKEVPKNFRADPPKKPQNNYGRGSI